MGKASSPGRQGQAWRASWSGGLAGTQETPGGGRGTEHGEMGAGPGREEGRADPSRRGHPEPEAPPLSSEGARSWFPAPAWEPETTEGAVIAPRCLWAMGEAALKFPPRPALSPGGASPGRSQLAQRGHERGRGRERLGSAPGAQDPLGTCHVDNTTHACPHRA